MKTKREFWGRRSDVAGNEYLEDCSYEGLWSSNAFGKRSSLITSLRKGLSSFIVFPWPSWPSGQMESAPRPGDVWLLERKLKFKDQLEWSSNGRSYNWNESQQLLHRNEIHLYVKKIWSYSVAWSTWNSWSATSLRCCSSRLTYPACKKAQNQR